MHMLGIISRSHLADSTSNADWLPDGSGKPAMSKANEDLQRTAGTKEEQSCER